MTNKTKLLKKLENMPSKVLVEKYIKNNRSIEELLNDHICRNCSKRINGHCPLEDHEDCPIIIENWLDTEEEKPTITYDWLINTLSTNGINSRKIVKETLRNASSLELYDLILSLQDEAAKRRGKEYEY